MSKPTITLSHIATGLGLLASGAGIVTTWALMQYRIDQLETRLDEIAVQAEALEAANAAQASEVKCLICQTHNIPCPGC